MTDTLSLITGDKPRRGGARKDAHAPQPAPATARTGLEQIVAMLSRPEGASLAELTLATAWQAHSVRGALAGNLRRKGYAIVSEKVDGERRYRIGVGQ